MISADASWKVEHNLISIHATSSREDVGWWTILDTQLTKEEPRNSQRFMKETARNLTSPTTASPFIRTGATQVV